jgi:hypothetical protein
MDTALLLVSASAFFTVGYGVFWTVRAMRRVGLRRFAQAVGVLCWNLLKAILRLFKPERANSGKAEMGSDISMDFVGDSQTDRGASIPGPHAGYNYRTGTPDDGSDPAGWYLEDWLDNDRIH